MSNLNPREEMLLEEFAEVDRWFADYNPESDQLKLFYRGKDYIVDSVSPAKVKATLLLLGGYEVVPSADVESVPINNQDIDSFPVQSDKLQESVSAQMSGSEVQQNDGSLRTSCTNCGIGSIDTPRMRPGPDGKHSLCNACWIWWTRKGTVRNVSGNSNGNNVEETEQSESEAMESDEDIFSPWKEL